MSQTFVLVCLLATIAGSRSFELETKPERPDTVFINNFHWPADAAEMKNIPDKKELVFENAEIDTVDRNFTNQFETCTGLAFWNGTVKTVYVSPALVQLELWNTSAENVIIERGHDYQLKELYLAHANINRVPENLNELKELRWLQIESTSIDHITLDQFNGLDKLENMSLCCNNLKQLDSSVSLPKLSTLWLTKNQLHQIDVCRWNMPSLRKLHLQENKLAHFAIGHLSALEEIHLKSNPLNCAWKDRFSEYSTKKTLATDSDDITCDNETKGDFRLECPAD